MPQRETTLETAAFLESPQAAALTSIPKAEAQLVLERFLDVCFTDLGKAPRTLDGDDLHGVLGHLLPHAFGRRDLLARHVGAVLRCYFDFLETRAILSQAYELRQSLEDTLPHFLSAVESGKTHHHGHGAPQAPIVNRGEKVGRNDPCPCGSGKKFKQCCAKLGA